VESHISRKTSEIWGTRRLFGIERADGVLTQSRGAVQLGPRCDINLNLMGDAFVLTFCEDWSSLGVFRHMK